MGKYLELFTGSFDESIQEKTKLENRPYVAYSIKEDKVVYTIVKLDNGKYKVYCARKENPIEVEYKAVDLGLKKQARDDNGVALFTEEDGNMIPIMTEEPLYFADKNIGATNPYESGTYFAWGETTGISYTSIDCELTFEEVIKLFTPTFILLDMPVPSNEEELDELIKGIGFVGGKDLTDICKYLKNQYGAIPYEAFTYGDYKYSDKDAFFYPTYDDVSGITKYNTIDNKISLEPSDDAAYVNIGKGWRVPTIYELLQLFTSTDLILEDENGNKYWYYGEAYEVEVGVDNGAPIYEVRWSGGNVHENVNNYPNFYDGVSYEQVMTGFKGIHFISRTVTKKDKNGDILMENGYPVYESIFIPACKPITGSPNVEYMSTRRSNPMNLFSSEINREGYICFTDENVLFFSPLLKDHLYSTVAVNPTYFRNGFESDIYNSDFEYAGLAKVAGLPIRAVKA